MNMKNFGGMPIYLFYKLDIVLCLLFFNQKFLNKSEK